MTLKQVIQAFSIMSQEQQIGFLASYGHYLTLVARETYEVGTDQVLD